MRQEQVDEVIDGILKQLPIDDAEDVALHINEVFKVVLIVSS